MVGNAILFEKVCRGCGNYFKTDKRQQTRCKPKCGWFSENRSTSKAIKVQFIGVDGEGVTLPDGTHNYVLLSVGNQSLKSESVEHPLTFWEIMPFLWQRYLENPTATFVGFYLSYDFSQWFKHLPENRARMLLTTTGRAKRQPRSEFRVQPFPVKYQGWEFDVLGLRRFKVRPESPENTPDTPFLYINDAGAFWQTSFLSAIDPRNWSDNPLLTAEEYELIKRGKTQRQTATLNDEMVLYNVTENRILARAMSRLNEGFETQGWKLNRNQWFGPGQVAQKWLNSINAPDGETVRKTLPDAVQIAAQAAYYGGWFEIPRHGHIPGTTYEYDINSAYPHVIETLPCLLHGKWIHGKTRGKGSKWRLLNVTTQGSDPFLGGLPHRDHKGIISRPRNVTGWYWETEIAAAMRARLIDDYTVNDAWSYDPCDCPLPYADIRRLYNQRLKVGKNTSQGKALKLVYNSSYGKFAQSIGNPKYSNAICASLITSGCRTLILDAIATHPNGSRDVVMVATDGVYFRTAHKGLDCTANELGKWEEGVKQNLTLFMPGVYWDDKTRASLDDETPKLKSRGINARELAKHILAIDEMFTGEFTSWPSITIPISFSVVSPLLALARNDWGTCGKILTYEHNDLTRTMSADPTNKRDTSLGVYYDDGIWTTHPYDERGKNYGYSKSFGADLEQIAQLDPFLTDDGSITREIVEFLGIE